VSAPLNPKPTHSTPRNRRGGKIGMDGASYHMRCVNPSPTKGWKRPAMIEWLEANHPSKLTPADKADWKPGGKGGLTIPQIFAIVEPLKPPKKIAAYAIAAKYGHEVRCLLTPPIHPSHLALLFLCLGDLIWGWRIGGGTGAVQIDITPAYCAHSAPPEVGWANVKNPISRVETRSLAHLEEQVIKSIATHCTEEMWLGAYRTTRQWEDERYVDLGCDVASDEEGEEADAMDIVGEDSEFGEDEGEA
jgi:hypothetical protein